MQPRIDTTRVSHDAYSRDAYKAMRASRTHVDATSLELSLRELMKIRASQINGCAYCLHVHARDARLERRIGFSGQQYAQSRGHSSPAAHQ